MGAGGPGVAGGSLIAGGRRLAAAHAVVADLGAPALDDDDALHLRSVLRLRRGEVVSATDGRGAWRPCLYVPDGVLVPDGDVVVESRPSPAITVAFAAVKGDRPDWAVQKLTEAGVDRIVVVRTERSVVRWQGPRAASHLERLRRVARQAAMQSRRVWLPQVAGVEPFAAVAGGGPAAGVEPFAAVAGGGPGAGVGAGLPGPGTAPGGAGVALAAPGGGPPSLAFPTLLVGPEGGWSEEESSRGLPVVSLGPGIMRTETAAVAAGVLLVALRSGLVSPASFG